MKNIAVIFAGGSGSRMNTVSRPKQFLELHGKPIIIYTLELFDVHPNIDGIIVVCIEPWIPLLKEQIRKFEINKIKKIVSGGVTGQDSIYNGLIAAKEISMDEKNIVLIHDGIRPLITEQTITDNINMVKQEGSCITCIPATETFIVNQSDGSIEIPTRDKSLIARAPQSFFLNDILKVHKQARAEGRHDFIDSCSMMHHYGYRLGRVIGPMENIKITTPTDYFVFKAMIEMHENQQFLFF